MSSTMVVCSFKEKPEMVRLLDDYRGDIPRSIVFRRALLEYMKRHPKGHILCTEQEEKEVGALVAHEHQTPDTSLLNIKNALDGSTNENSRQSFI